MKKAFFLISILTTLVWQLPAQTIVNVKQYGAKGNGKTDDTYAILKAVDRVNQLGRNVTLYFPKGVYIVKPQKINDGAGPAFLPIDILNFKDCAQLTIKGDKGTRIRFASNLYYGTFQKAGNRINPLSGVTTDYNVRVAVGSGIILSSCTDVQVTNLEIDGNSAGFITGGQFGDVGYQIDNDGIFIQDSRNITINNVFAHHFGRDGIMVLNKTPNGFATPNQKIVVKNSRFENNGRQGFSWCGGIGFTADNTSFSFTGKGKFNSPPGAGIDFEPNGGYVVKDGLFTNCVIQNNSGVGVLADQGSTNVYGVQFKGCRIQGNVSPACWVRSPAFSFETCIINGSFYFGFAAEKATDGTRFTSCVFSDDSISNPSINYLIESNGAKFMSFSGCTFTAKQKGVLFIAGGSSQYGERPVFTDCSFKINYKKPAAVASLFSTNVDFAGNTSFTNTGENEGWNLSASAFNGFNGKAASVTVGSKLNMATYGQVSIGDGMAATVAISNNAALQMNTNAHLTIAKNGTLVLKKGGALWIAPGAELTIAGKLIVEEGAYLCIHNQAKLSEQSRKNIILNGKPFFTDNPQMNYGYSGCIIIGQ